MTVTPLKRVTKTVRAERDLEEIWFYIATDNLAAADTLLDTIGRRCRLLLDQPGLGRARPELAPDLRSFSVGRYLLFYVPQAQGIEVVRVLHGSRDIDEIFDTD